MGNIGTEEEEIELVPLSEPAAEPVPESVPEKVPEAEPIPA